MDYTKSGLITSDETWDHYVLVTGDVTVPRNKTLTITAWTRVEFDTTDDQKTGEDTTKCELNISNGVLNATGTEHYKIIFTSFNTSPIKGDWTGIKFFGTPSNSSQIEYCQIEWAHKGVSCSNCSIDVSETVLSNCNYGAYVTGDSFIKLALSEVTCDNCSYGIRVQNGKAKLWNSDFKQNSVGIGYFSAQHYFPGGPSRQPDIKNCEVSNNGWGIILDDSSPIINYCEISDNTQWGLQCLDDSDPVLGYDTLSYNGETSKVWYMSGSSKSGPPQPTPGGGLFCSGTSCPIVCTGPVSGPYVRGRNVIIDNNGDGVHCGEQSNPKLGKCQFPGLQPGLNSLGDNVGYDVCNTTGSTVYAEANWWGEAPPDPSEIYGPVSWFSYLDSLPSKGASSGESGRFVTLNIQERNATRYITKGENPDSKGTAEDYNELGTYYLLQMMYDEAIEAFQYVLTNFPDCYEANYALVHLMQCYKEGGYQADIIPYLGNLSSSSSNPELKNLALYLSISQLCREGQYGQALNRCQALLAAGCDEEMERDLRFRTGMLYRYGLEDDEAAIAAFQDFIDRYPEGPFASIAQLELEILGVSHPPKAATGGPPAKPTVPVPEVFALYQNYPNPFNTQTCIEYELPKAAQVSLRVYNILGQNVKTLTSDFQPAGHYQVFWDGRDSQSIEVASGIYFIRFEAGTYALTRKMVLLR